MDWDDVRYFLAVARRGSVKSAAELLDVNHSTVLRRIAHLENGLGARVFNKLPAGYRLTEAGEDILEIAIEMEASSNRLQSRVLGRDQAVRGSLRVTLSPTLATHLLMPDFADFARLHPEVELDILSSDQPVNLTNREADVALRVVYDRQSLPLNLHGLKGPEIAGSAYLSYDLLEALRSQRSAPVRWIIKAIDGLADWTRDSEITVNAPVLRTTEAGAQITAVREGLGMATLPCFVGDPDPLLTRVPGIGVQLHGTLWILTQGETRKTKRVRLFTEFMSSRLAGHAPLLAGKLIK